MSATTLSHPGRRLLAYLRREWFLGGMIGAVLLASLAPELGRSGGTLRVDRLADVGIALVFFLHGLGISFASLRDGLLRWRVHVVVQVFTFAVFPLLWFALDALVGRWLPAGLVLGFCYLCALPSTISSSVAMTGVARGNVPAAIFNATLSSLLGIVLTPAIIALSVSVGGQWLSFGAAVLSIAKLLLLPLVLGQLLRPLLHRWHQKYKRHTNLLDRWVILLLVYAAFCDSVASGLWREHGASLLALALVGAALILAVVLLLSTWLCRRLGFSAEDEIAAVFCGSKKTLASGVPMAKLLFGAHPALGLIVLPIMFYHQLQLFVCSLLAARYAARS
ncbi:bile acid:sodium symporter [bacterium]|nr:MAG: bile acid:sodium symporter [bacterium]